MRVISEGPGSTTLQFGFDFPAEYMPDYGRELTCAVSMAAMAKAESCPY
jgi:hypothetical protein